LLLIVVAVVVVSDDTTFIRLGAGSMVTSISNACNRPPAINLFKTQSSSHFTALRVEGIKGGMASTFVVIQKK
jgi:hypothetical protein